MLKMVQMVYWNAYKRGQMKAARPLWCHRQTAPNRQVKHLSAQNAFHQTEYVKLKKVKHLKGFFALLADRSETHSIQIVVVIRFNGFPNESDRRL